MSWKNLAKEVAEVTLFSALGWVIMTGGSNYIVTSHEIKSNPKFNKEEFEDGASSGGFSPKILNSLDRKIIETFNITEKQYLHIADFMFGLGKYGRPGRNLAYWVYNK